MTGADRIEGTERMGTLGERRGRTRFAVRWQAECRIGGHKLAGIIRDVSIHGMFFELSAKAAEAARLADVDDPVILSYVPSPASSRVVRVASVRWSGLSSKHGCVGFGLQHDAARASHRRTTGPG